jgi:hypothetical protein
MCGAFRKRRLYLSRVSEREFVYSEHVLPAIVHGTRGKHVRSNVRLESLDDVKVKSDGQFLLGR